jgi:hypothetical protein
MKIVKSLCIFLISCCFAQNCLGQQSAVNAPETTNGPLSVDINLGLGTKLRSRIEYRFNRNNSVLFCHTQHYGQLYHGSQFYLAYNRFFNIAEKRENFFYLKAGYGRTYHNIGAYVLIGGGLGERMYLGKKKHFFFQYSAGIKISPVISGEVEINSGTGFRGLYYIVGPGAVPELNLGFGYSF